MNHKITSYSLIIIAFLVGSCGNLVVIAPTDVEDKVAVCNNNSQRRLVTLDYLVGKYPVPCQVVYEKQTENPDHRQVLWEADQTVGYCEQKMEEFIQTLNGEGWQCSYDKQNHVTPVAKTTPPEASEKQPEKVDYSRLFHGQDQIVICTNNSKRRRVTLDYQAEEKSVPCQVIYEKPTEMPDYRQVLWYANQTEGYCEQKMDGFIRKLEGYGWQCEYRAEK
jgi:hypothetical protein